MEEIKKLLGLFGLNEKEIKVYIACMQLGKDTAFNIAEKSGVKRATVYLILHSLISKSLVVVSKTEKSSFYSATSPQNLVSQLDYRKREIEQSLPSIMAIYNSQPEKPSIEIFEGIDGVKQIYGEITKSLKDGEDIIFYGDLTHFEEQKAVLKDWIRETKITKSSIREILATSDTHKKYKDEIEANKNPNHKVKLLPIAKNSFLNDNAIFGDKLVIFSTQKNFFATVITSKEIVTSYRTMFNLVWETV